MEGELVLGIEEPVYDRITEVFPCVKMSTPDSTSFAAAQTWRGSVFIAMSPDGFIARSDSNLDWLTDPPADPEHEEISSDRPALGWDAFMAEVDHLVMGRGTYEKILTFERWPQGDRPVIVLSSSLENSADSRIIVLRSVAETAEHLARSQARNVYIDGGRTIQGFLRADLVDEVTVGIAPVLLGAGTPLFGVLAGDIRLRLRANHAGQGGMTHTTYDVVRSGVEDRNA